MESLSHEEKIRHQFGLRAPTFNRSAHWITNETLASAMAKAAGTPAKGVALCCGTGVMGKHLKTLGWDITGVDITPEMVKTSSQFFPAVVANVEKMPFEQATFDLAIMRQAYFLLGDGPSALREISRVLKPSGRFVLAQTVPFSGVDTPWLKQIHQTKQHQMTRFFTADDLADELGQHGFKVRAMESVTVRESVSLWMANAPEMEPERRERVLHMIREAPESYRRLRNVAVENGELLEDWNWVILTAEPVGAAR